MKRLCLFLCFVICINATNAQVSVRVHSSVYENYFAKYYRERDIEKAIDYGYKWKKAWEEEETPKNKKYCMVYEKLSDLLYYKGNYNEAASILSEILSIKIKLNEQGSNDYSRILGNLALINCDLGNYQEARLQGLENLEIVGNNFGTDSYEYAVALNNLSLYYSHLDNYKEAIRLCTKSLDIKKRILGAEHESYVNSVSNLASYYYDSGKCQEAVHLGKEVLEKRKRILGTSHPEYAKSLSNLANYNVGSGNYQDAIRLGKEALEIRKQILGTKHPEYAESLTNLVSIYDKAGNSLEGIRLGKDAMKVMNTDHPYYALLLNNIASCYSNIGEYTEAIHLCTKAMELNKALLGTTHSEYATCLHNLGDYYSSLGNYEEAINMCTEALKIRKKIFGSEHPDYARSLNNLAMYKSHRGNNKEAVHLVAEAIEIFKNVYGPEHPDYATSLNNLAKYNFSLGNNKEAIRIGTEAMEINKKILGAQHPNYALSLINLGSYYSSLGSYSESLNFDNEALDILNNTLGTRHPWYSLLLSEMAYYNYKQGHYSDAYKLIEQSTSLSRDYILYSFSGLSSSFHESLWNDNHARLFNTLFPSLVFRHQTRESISELYDKTALFAKGILLNTSIGMRKLILESGDSKLLSKYEKLLADKTTYEKQLEKPIKERLYDVDSLYSLIQRQEMELARESKAYGDFAQNLRISWKDVQQKLDKDDIAIEFLDFQVSETKSKMYVALTLKKGYDSPHMIPLFEKKQLDAISQRNYYTQTSLYELIWKPLAEELKGARDIYFSPTGSLHRIGIEYVPVSDTENIFDQYRLHRLSSTRQLAFIQDETSGKDNVLYGGLVYDAHPSQTDKLADNRSFTYMNRADVDSLSLRGSYEYLPGTKDEADNIASYLKKYGQSYVYRSGAQGTEESFKQLDGSRPKTLHIATHGFYMTQEDAEIQRLASGVRLGDEGSHYQEDKPMTRSGLLLSGCGPALKHETLPEGVEDGILTAQEISKLDLRGLDLVVLSACQTGLGDIISGEGVFGLQRGFKNAGARTIIMSLWKVSDSATQQLMSSFYSHYLQGKGKEESFRLAQSELREKDSSNQSKPDWAAFVMLDGVNL